MQVRFTNGGAGVYSLSDDGVTVMSYAPKVGDFDKGSVVDTLEVFLQAASLAAMQAIKDQINFWLALAREQMESANETKIFLEIRQAGESDWRRSEILSGKLQPLPGTLDSHSQLKQMYQLAIERRNWWEWPEEEIALSDDLLAYDTGGKTVDNICTGLHFQNLAGDPQMPIPIRVEIESQGAAGAFDDLIIAINTFAPVLAGLNQHILEGEAGTPTSTQASVNARGGNYNHVTWSGAALADSYLVRWNLTASRFAGRWFRVLARIKSNFTGTMRLRAVLQYSGASYPDTAPMAATPETLLESDSVWRLVDLGALQIPTFATSVAAADVTLALRATIDSYPGDVDVDFVFLAPVDSFYRARNTGASAPESWGSVVVDGRINKAYATDYTSGKSLDTLSSITRFPTVWPLYLQWLVVAQQFDDPSDGMDISVSMTVRAYYRPRRVTV